MQNIVTLVLGGGRGTRLHPLTKIRSKPAVPLAGKYRLIDIPLSNCINSAMRRIYVLTQFMSVSLHRHIRQTYRFDRFSNGFVEILAAQQTMEDAVDWYQGTADAVRKNLKYLNQPGIDYVLILSGDQLYRMDYREMLRTHQQSGAAATIAALPVSREEARHFGVMRIDASGRVVGFVEKPKTDEALEQVRMDPSWFQSHGIANDDREILASMGIYLFNRETLVELLESTTHEDFGKEVFPGCISSKRVCVHPFDGYWRDIGTIRSFFDANLAMAKKDPPFSLYQPAAPVYTHSRFLPPTRIGDTKVVESMIADGCKIGNGCKIERSVIGVRCVIGDNVTIRDAIVMGADCYETDHDLAENGAVGRPSMGIGAGSTIQNAIIDKDCRIGKNVRIESADTIADIDVTDDCCVRDGIAMVTKDATIPDGWDMSAQRS